MGRLGRSGVRGLQPQGSIPHLAQEVFIRSYIFFLEEKMSKWDLFLKGLGREVPPGRLCMSRLRITLLSLLSCIQKFLPSPGLITANLLFYSSLWISSLEPWAARHWHVFPSSISSPLLPYSPCFQSGWTLPSSILCFFFLHKLYTILLAFLLFFSLFTCTSTVFLRHHFLPATFDFQKDP